MYGTAPSSSEFQPPNHLLEPDLSSPEEVSLLGEKETRLENLYLIF